MNGLRVYIDSQSADLPRGFAIGIPQPKANRVFYTRRGNGPIYRWLYEKNLAHWRFLRMKSTDLDPSKLCAASWKSVPETLRAQLGQHYLD